MALHKQRERGEQRKSDWGVNQIGFPPDEKKCPDTLTASAGRLWGSCWFNVMVGSYGCKERLPASPGLLEKLFHTASMELRG